MATKQLSLTQFMPGIDTLLNPAFSLKTALANKVPKNQDELRQDAGIRTRQVSETREKEETRVSPHIAQESA
ncbi:MAG: hypothetical protein AABY01_03415 [Nanoarchaeota archaeon]